jgi:ribosome biogenesis GTPase
MRIVAQHRDGVEVHDGNRLMRARVLPKLKSRSSEERPCVGDFAFVGVRAGEQVVLELLPRHGVLRRAAAGERYAVQLLASNIDIAIIVCGMDRDFSVKRIQRYLTLVAGSDIEAMVVLSKADQHDGGKLQEARRELPGLAPENLLALDLRHENSARQLLPRLARGTTAVVLGSSGAGKSTLTNTLLGQALQRTGATRQSDGRGRHTTVHRQLVRLPSGGCLIDTPGLREIKLLGDEEQVAECFDDIESMAANCRFRDCAHGFEPGCAVRASVAAGTLSEVRLEHYFKLALEAQSQKIKAVVQERMRGRLGDKMLKEASKLRGKPR